MYRRIASKPAGRMFVSDERVFIRSNEGMHEEQKLYELSLDGQIISCLPILYSKFLRAMEVEKEQFLCWYLENKEDGQKTLLRFYSLDGILLLEVQGAERLPRYIPVSPDLSYMVLYRIAVYHPISLSYRDLGEFEGYQDSFFISGFGSIYFFGGKGNTELIAMCDNHGTGLEEVYRLDFSESDRWKGFLGNKNLPGTVELLNFYKDDMWITTPERVHRIEVSTGRTLEIRDYPLPKLFLKDNIAYSLTAITYTIMDMDSSTLLCYKTIDTFTIHGRSHSCDFETRLLKDGYLYLSVSIWGGPYLLSIFDTCTEQFVWYDIWGEWPIESVHIIDDRLIAYAEGEVRIYVRSNDSHVAPTDMFLSMN